MIGIKKCKGCELDLALTEFNVAYQGARGPIYRARCKTCSTIQSVEFGRTNPNKKYNWIKHKYGLTKDQYLKLWNDQKGLCAICTKSMSKPYVDHDHKTGKVRQLFCNHCNVMIAQSREDIAVMKKGIDYLERWS